MPHFVIEQPGQLERRVEIKTGEMSLGRADDNNIVLVADEVSRHHAKVYCRDGQVVLMDLKSMNGTYVNKQKVVERVLSNKDEVLLGAKCRLLFEDQEPPELKGSAEDTSLRKNLSRIREEMDMAASNMTMMYRREESKGPADMPSEEEVKVMRRAFRRLDAVYKATSLLASSFDLEQRLTNVLDTAMEVTGADRGFIMFVCDETGELKISVARGMETDDKESLPSMGIAERAARDNEPILMASADGNQEFGGRESIIRQAIRSAMCVPLSVEDRSLGSIYVDIRRVGMQFNEEDLELFGAMAGQSALAIDNVKLYEQMLEAEKERANLGRFVSPAVVEEILKGGSNVVLGGRKQIVTTMFADIRGFTPMSERLGPAELVDIMNEHFTAMTHIIFDHEGTLDKYIGDEVMAIFGAPIAGRDDSERAVRAALDMQAKNHELNGIRKAEGRPELRMGIGIYTGEAIAGYVGSPMRMDFTVIGDNVNTARRLCDVARGGETVTGESTLKSVESFVDFEDLNLVKLEGKEKPVQAYKITNLK